MQWWLQNKGYSDIIADPIEYVSYSGRHQETPNAGSEPDRIESIHSEGDSPGSSIREISKLSPSPSQYGLDLLGRVAEKQAPRTRSTVISEVARFLKPHGLQALAEPMVKLHEIDASMLLTLSAEELTLVGVPLARSRELVEAFQMARENSGQLRPGGASSESLSLIAGGSSTSNLRRGFGSAEQLMGSTGGSAPNLQIRRPSRPSSWGENLSSLDGSDASSPPTTKRVRNSPAARTGATNYNKHGQDAKAQGRPPLPTSSSGSNRMAMLGDPNARFKKKQRSESPDPMVR